MTENVPYTSDERVKEMLELVEKMKESLTPEFHFEFLRLELLIKKEYESNKRRPS